ncbi:hypothetical protein SAMN02745221_01069 [Thermosyntropha lipolytica DSM 11003]|uniref:Uncharacterized protein n=1 Tax=Thermosyntropha lipolytica DSM 11003 TaxID=1123382 RepID=A0A1M5N1A8_9FIRM|nr:hypothetical protein [Thermosyntropha lipolytica]SHG83235.1 hypothetical protein SAMN02745221_01069 [Thermosyntropha lipolytica DSM 11003]
MFFTFLNKENPCCLDFSIFQSYPPAKVLFYFYNAALKIPVEYYLKLSEEAQPTSCQKAWLSFLEDNLKIIEDIENFVANEYLENLGPYYYPFTNTCFYFIKGKEEERITAEDLSILENLRQSPDMDKEIHDYYKARKNSKKPYKTKEELLKDINMCIASLKETEILNRHINFLHKLLENRSGILEQEEIMPFKPDNIPSKPQKPEKTGVNKENLIFFNFSKKTKAKSSEIYHQERKIYFIRYREYEKACDRYKEVLKDWENIKQEFINKCEQEIREIEHRLKQAHRALDVYNTIIERSFIHSNYQEVKTLEAFKNYLETGRAISLQECMNIYEEEKYWQEIRDSQYRIENTIYFLQNINLAEYREEEILSQLRSLENKVENKLLPG